jgi:hypothetical protein
MLLLALMVPAFAADPTGTWKSTFEGPEGSIDLFFKFQLSGEALTGSVGGPMGEIPISNGKVDGDSISFTAGGDQFSFDYKGKISGDEMKLEVEGPQGMIELLAKRQP